MVVVGGGVIGACSALELARTGARVVVLERGVELAAECSFGNAGLLGPSHATPLADPANVIDGARMMFTPGGAFSIRPRAGVVPWLTRFLAASTPGRARESRDVLAGLFATSLSMHEELAGAGLATGLRQSGLLYVYESEKSFESARKQAAAERTAGDDPRTLEGDQVRDVEPTVTGSPAGAIFYPGDAHCDPVRFVRAIGDAAVASGASVRTEVEVLGFERRGDRVDKVVTAAGSIRANWVVIAAGVWTRLLARALGVFVPIEAGKGYHVDFAPARAELRVPVAFENAHVVATPLPGRVRLSGTLQLDGVDKRVDQRRVDSVIRAGRHGVAGLDGASMSAVWRGLRPLTPDDLPVIGRPPALDNVVLATGHGASGLALSLVTGKLVSEIITGRTPTHDLWPLRPDRFAQPLVRARRLLRGAGP